MLTPHGGGLDAYGCHYNRKAGGYHCHKGSSRANRSPHSRRCSVHLH
ncbi:MAG TPA: YHYH domain-containing protein [Candidatus Binatia bacterium]|nr:YHYH domain-containing protein [Candidatus Binatia bacterium]